MQLLDDDMDELFRNAASQYPLKTDGSDWDAVMRRLPQSNSQQTSSNKRLRDSKWLKWLWRPLLTFLLFITCVSVLKMGNLPPREGSGTSISNTGVTTTAPLNTTESDKMTLKNNKSVPDNTESDNSTSVSNIPVPEKAGSTTTVSNIPAQVNTARNNVTTVGKINVPVKAGMNNSTSVSNIPVQENSAGNNATAKIVVPLKKQGNTPFKNNGSNNLVPANTNNSTGISLTGLTDNSGLSLHLLPTASENEESISAHLQTGRVITKLALHPDSTVSAPSVKLKVPVQKGLYAGIVASPDFSTVKGQRVSKVGYNAGVIVGYRISRRVAVETGVLFERKYYYSKGSYFSTKKIPTYPGMKIINVDGWCRMIEIPLNVRYVFKIKEKSNWYVNGGVSSYIMGKESYDYKYELDNNIDTKNWAYKNSTRNWFSIIHVGVGYEHRLGAIGTLRVEPYLKIPAGGVGIGNLPLTSVGLNVGITRPIRF
ncbi:Outer membrane protein beta-barrel domain-containing protein [Chitinophaga sp. CF118]|uniref:outer membrane beta-barrel protein n=1 Tax=Chitinophaga sp. CF118 TaxID=1884367 RepID=UPI0008EFB520|nr:outer membrane beta-barrel protein [Chitinophaga sp. CF118]SFD01735.1 Outer membrane protein beta-barrel domain-containing protein [Chitinophaga sp. CF118]